MHNDSLHISAQCARIILSGWLGNHFILQKMSILIAFALQDEITLALRCVTGGIPCLPVCADSGNTAAVARAIWHYT